MKAALTVALLLCLAVSVSAQTVVPANATLKLEATHDGQATDGYRIYVDNAKVVDVPKSALVNGTLTASVPPQSAGAHLVQFSAYNSVSEAKSQAVPFTAIAAPLAPSDLKLSWTITISGGPTEPAK